MFENLSIESLSYQREFIWELAWFRTWRSQSTSDISISHVHICSLDQIFTFLLLLLLIKHVFWQLENISENTIFRDVHVFVNRAKNFVNTQNVEIIRSNLYKCLKKDALTWHTSLLTNMKKRLLTINIELIEWKNALMTEFWKSTFKIMKTIASYKTIHYARRFQSTFTSWLCSICHSTK